MYDPSDNLYLCEIGLLLTIIYIPIIALSTILPTKQTTNHMI